MMNRVHLRGISLAWSVIALQMGIGVVAGIVMFAWHGKEEGAAALFGAVIVAAPNAYFAIRFYLRNKGASAQVVLGNLYRAEAGKLLLTGLLFYFGVRWFPAQFAPLMLSSIACLFVPWLMLLARID